MLAVTREMLLEHVMALSALIDRYAARDPEFVAAALDWLTACEATLQRLRNPLAGSLATERARILAAGDGHREPNQPTSASAARKVVRVTASTALAHAEAELRGVIAGIDHRFLGFREKMAQLLAVASTAHAIPLPDGAPREQWLIAVWQVVGQAPEGRSMAAYLGGALHPSDLWFVLGETLDNLLGNSGAQDQAGGS